MNSKKSRIVQKYVVVGFNTEAYAPEEIASVSGILPTYKSALKCLKECVREDDELEGCKIDREQGICVNPEGHRGYYVQEVFEFNENNSPMEESDEPTDIRDAGDGRKRQHRAEVHVDHSRKAKVNRRR